MSLIPDNLYKFAIATQDLIKSVNQYIDDIFLEHKEEIIKLLTENYSDGVILTKFYKWFKEDKPENNKITNFEYLYKNPVNSYTDYKKYDNIVKFKLTSKRGEFYNFEIYIKIFCGYKSDYVFVEYKGEFNSSFHKNAYINKRIENSFCLNILEENKED